MPVMRSEYFLRAFMHSHIKVCVIMAVYLSGVFKCLIFHWCFYLLVFILGVFEKRRLHCIHVYLSKPIEFYYDYSLKLLPL